MLNWFSSSFLFACWPENIEEFISDDIHKQSRTLGAIEAALFDVVVLWPVFYCLANFFQLNANFFFSPLCSLPMKWNEKNSTAILCSLEDDRDLSRILITNRKHRQRNSLQEAIQRYWISILINKTTNRKRRKSSKRIKRLMTLNLRDIWDDIEAGEAVDKRVDES